MNTLNSVSREIKNWKNLKDLVISLENTNIVDIEFKRGIITFIPVNYGKVTIRISASGVAEVVIDVIVSNYSVDVIEVDTSDVRLVL